MVMRHVKTGLLLAASAILSALTLIVVVHAPDTWGGQPAPDQPAVSAEAADVDQTGSAPAQPAAQAETAIPPAVQAQPAPVQQTAALPPPETMLALVRVYIVALDQAMRTNNFTVLHALSSPFLQSRLNPDQLGQSFAGLYAARLDLTAAAILTPNLTELPAVLPNGMLHMIGVLPARARPYQFEMLFEPSQGEWKLAGINVTTLATPVAQAEPRPVVRPAKVKGAKDKLVK